MLGKGVKNKIRPCRVGAQCRKPCWVRKEVCLGPCRVRFPIGARIRKTKRFLPLFPKIRERGVFVLQELNTGLLKFLITIQ